MKHTMVIFAAVVTAVAASAGARAGVTLPPIFSDHMVLQSGVPAPVWGRADAGQTVRVALAGQEHAAAADESGRWRVVLDPLTPGAAGAMRVTGEGEAPIVIDDVMAGEVWLCAGQSNMDWYVLRLEAAREGTLAVDTPELRLFKTEMEATPTPAEHVRGRWVKATSFNRVRLFSAIGFLFGRGVHETMDVPVGMIQASWSGSRLMAWTPHDVLEAHPTAAAEFLAKERELGPGPANRAERGRLAAAHKKDPSLPEVPSLNQWPSRVYNGMIAPLIPYSLRGIVWYQGESDAWGPVPYRTLFPALIADWRERWGRPGLPFLFVQLPGWGKPAESPPRRSGWAELREAQALALDLPNTAMVVTTDIGGADIHPDNKEEVTRRLLAAAMATVYDRGDTPYRGPRFDGFTIDGSRVHVSFSGARGALTTRDGEPVRGFALAGEDRVWHWAQARIDDSSVVLESPDVPDPVAVRYDWMDLTIGNLTDATGLPAAPLRTDHW